MTKSLLISTIIFCATSALFGEIKFDSESSLYDKQNWYAQRNGGLPNITNDDSSVSMSTLSYDAYVWAYFEPATLEEGQSITFSGTAKFSSITTSGKFFLGLFNSGEMNAGNMYAYMGNANAVNSKDKPEYSATTITGGMEGIFTKADTAYIKEGSSTQYGALSTVNSAGVTLSKGTYTNPFSDPTVANKDYDFSFSILKTNSGYDVTTSFGSLEEHTVSFTSGLGLDTFDTVLIKQTGSGITLTNLQLTTTGSVARPAIPEPASAPVIFAFFTIALFAVKRRKRV